MYIADSFLNFLKVDFLNYPIPVFWIKNNQLLFQFNHIGNDKPINLATCLTNQCFLLETVLMWSQDRSWWHPGTYIKRSFLLWDAGICKSSGTWSRIWHFWSLHMDMPSAFEGFSDQRRQKQQTDRVGEELPFISYLRLCSVMMDQDGVQLPWPTCVVDWRLSCSLWVFKWLSNHCRNHLPKNLIELAI